VDNTLPTDNDTITIGDLLDDPDYWGSEWYPL
jgi:hypothetical protein